jgi:hypothetical protein
MIGSISAVPLTGIVPISNVLAPSWTVGMEDCGVIVVICAPGPVVELTLLLAAVLLLPTLLPLILLPLTLVTETITPWASPVPLFFISIFTGCETPGFKLVVVGIASKITLPGSIYGTVKACE